MLRCGGLSDIESYGVRVNYKQDRISTAMENSFTGALPFCAQLVIFGVAQMNIGIHLRSEPMSQEKTGLSIMLIWRKTGCRGILSILHR